MLLLYGVLSFSIIQPFPLRISTASELLARSLLDRLGSDELTSRSQDCLKWTPTTVLTVRTTETPRTTLEAVDITLALASANELRTVSACHRKFFFAFIWRLVEQTLDRYRHLLVRKDV